MRSPPAEIAAPVEDIDTPALIVDLDAFERNLAKMARVRARRGVRAAAARQDAQMPGDRAAADRARRRRPVRAEGRRRPKRSCAAACRDILVSNEVVGASKLRRLARARRGRDDRAVLRRCRAGRRGLARGGGPRRRARRRWSRSRSGWSAAASRPAAPRPRRSPAASRMRRTCASRACRPITAAPSICRPRPSARQAIDGAIEAVRETVEALAGCRPALCDRHRRRHRHVPSRGGERRLQRAAGRLIRLHGYRLRADRRRGRRALPRVRAQPVRARLGDERAGARPRHRRRGAQILQRREGPALGARPPRARGRRRLRRARQAPLLGPRRRRFASAKSSG